MTRLSQLNLNEPVTVEPMRAFPPIKDLVTDVSWNFRVKKQIQKFRPRAADAPDGTWRMQQRDIDRVQEFRKCIECFLCQDVCHVLRDHNKHEEFIGPRFFVYAANLEMNPLDNEDRVDALKNQHGIGYCNITKCCTRVCPEHIHITADAAPADLQVTHYSLNPRRTWSKTASTNFVSSGACPISSRNRIAP
jgi:succinate dehydrogenase / fumarate reductase iron-sulfur subunit